MKNYDAIVEAITAACPYTQAIYRFGSWGTPHQRTDSDLDIAVLLPHDIAVNVDIMLVLECDHILANMKNASGDTPLQCYIKDASTLRIGVVKALLEHGADASINDGDGRPLLRLLDSCYSIPDGLRDMLVENGAHSDEMRLSEDKPGRGDLLACSP